MTANEYALKMMIRARHVTDKANLAFFTDSDIYMNQMMDYIEELTDLVIEYNDSKETGEVL